MLTPPDYFRVARIVRLRRTNDYADFEHACVFYRYFPQKGVKEC